MYRSKRIFLRAFTQNDASSISELRADFSANQAAGGSPFPSNTDSQKEWISRMYPNQTLQNIYLVIEEVESSNFVGYCVATNINYINSNAHVGFYLHKNSRGKGYFKEAQVIFYSYLFNEINLNKLYSYAISYNEIAISTDKKIGFKQDGIMKEHIYQNGRYYDAIMLSLTKKDFFTINNISDYQ